MSENKDMKKQQVPKEKNPLTKPGDIKGKIEVPDTRERRDGIGGKTEADNNTVLIKPRNSLRQIFGGLIYVKYKNKHLLALN